MHILITSCTFLTAIKLSLSTRCIHDLPKPLYDSILIFLFFIFIQVSVGGVVEFLLPTTDTVNMIFKVLTVGTDGEGLTKWTVYFRSLAIIPDEFTTKLFARFGEAFRNHSNSRFDPHSYLVVTWILEKTVGEVCKLN